MMRGGRVYPDEPAGPFPAPPRSFEDAEGRRIELRAADGSDHEAVAAMYREFDPADRAQGIPPTEPSRIDEWLDELLSAGLNVVAWHDPDGGGREVAGHATLVPGGDPDADDDGSEDAAHELAIFVHQEYQGAGIGRRLLETLLGRGEAEGVEYVWLTVERWNHAAVGLYEDVGFERSGTESFELEMSIRLASATHE